jgi:hypothetical protein
MSFSLSLAYLDPGFSLKVPTLLECSGNFRHEGLGLSEYAGPLLGGLGLLLLDSASGLGSLAQPDGGARKEPRA